MINGVARESEHWHFFCDLLSKQDFCQGILCIDLPGTGIFYNQDSYITVQKLAKHCIEQYAKKQKISKTKSKQICLIGLSLGAIIGYQWIADCPGLFSHYVAINSSFLNLSQPQNRLKPFALARIMAACIGNNLQQRENTIYEIICNKRTKKTRLLCQSIQLSRPVSRKTIALQTIAGAIYYPPFLKIKPKGLVIASAKDKLVDPSCSFAIAKYLNFPIAVNVSAGHDIALDAPKWLETQIIKNFGL